jgi:hypothetical protein
MGFFRFIGSVSGINTQVEIFKKTIGRTVSDVQVKDISRIGSNRLWWAFGVIGKSSYKYEEEELTIPLPDVIADPLIELCKTYYNDTKNKRTKRKKKQRI